MCDNLGFPSKTTTNAAVTCSCLARVFNVNQALNVLVLELAVEQASRLPEHGPCRIMDGHWRPILGH